jgi:hypothetical protein
MKEIVEQVPKEYITKDDARNWNNSSDGYIVIKSSVSTLLLYKNVTDSPYRYQVVNLLTMQTVYRYEDMNAVLADLWNMHDKWYWFKDFRDLAGNLHRLC